MTVEGARLGRRLDNLRRERAALGRVDRMGETDPDIRRAIAAVVAAGEPSGAPRPVWSNAGSVDAASLATRLAEAVDGDAVETAHGWYVRRELRPVYLPIDRDRLAALPGMPAPATPLLCLDTETTGLGSAAGTVAFLIGIGWWQGDRMRLVQLLLPDLSEEGALLDTLAAETPPGACLVTYNGRTFDWPLLETRFRMGRRVPPALDGHLDLLLLVRRLFRHRLPDARLQTVERHLLRRHRAPDIPSWEIPAAYHSFLRGGSATPIRVVARHNVEDVVTLGRILAHIERGYGEGEVRRWAPPGDLVRLARLFRHEGRVDEAVACLEIAAAPMRPSRRGRRRVEPPRDGAGAAGRTGLDRAGQRAGAPRTRPGRSMGSHGPGAAGSISQPRPRQRDAASCPGSGPCQASSAAGASPGARGLRQVPGRLACRRSTSFPAPAPEASPPPDSVSGRR
jgi:uncharacterized protein YprB with RNaseH-like and TPR domain